MEVPIFMKSRPSFGDQRSPRMAVGLLSKAFLTIAALVLFHHAARAMPPGGRTFRLEMDEPNRAEPNTAEPNMDEGNDDSPIMDGVNMDEPSRGDLGTGDKAETQVGQLTTRAPNPNTNTGDKISRGGKGLGRAITKTLTKLRSSRTSRQKSILNAPSRRDLKESDAKREEIRRKFSTKKRISSSVSSVGSFSGSKSFGGGSVDETSSGGSRSPDEKSPGRSPNKPRSPNRKSSRGKADRQDGVSFPTSDLVMAKKRVPPKLSLFKEEGNTGEDEAGETVDWLEGIKYPTISSARAPKKVPSKSSSFKDGGNTGKDGAGDIDVSFVSV